MLLPFGHYTNLVARSAYPATGYSQSRVDYVRTQSVHSRRATVGAHMAVKITVSAKAIC